MVRSVHLTETRRIDRQRPHTAMWQRGPQKKVGLLFVELGKKRQHLHQYALVHPHHRREQHIEGSKQRIL
jgi:hypothetical protein